MAVEPVTAPPFERPRPSRSPSDLLAEGRSIRSAATSVLEKGLERERAAKGAFDAARAEIVQQQLASMPIARLRETTAGGVRLGAIEKAGIKTVAQALNAGVRLQTIPGVGQHSATQVVAAARQVERALQEGVRMRFDLEGRPSTQGKLLAALRAHEMAEQAMAPIQSQLLSSAATLDALTKRAARTSSRMRMFFSTPRKRDDARAALTELSTVLQSPKTQTLKGELQKVRAALDVSPPKPREAWQDFEQRVATYNGLLIQVGGLSDDREAIEGFVEAELAARVHEHPLDTSALTISLRGYQAFGAKFALAQKKAILGDEMGLGKTVEALAAMSHASSEGGTHFLVVCPASVLINWIHETERHSVLEAHRLHGAEIERNYRLWAQRGGVGVSTFGSLQYLVQPKELELAVLVVDEAHYVKNPRALRTRAVAEWIPKAQRTLFLSGTPMENRVEEFRNLVSLLDQSIAGRVRTLDGLAGATAFRTAVAPVYLRRNQADVLQELPPRIENEEWVELGEGDLRAYIDAVASGNFMAMRQAAYVPAGAASSAKLRRLEEIVEESMANGLKIVVFSYFRRVLESVAGVLGDAAVGPLNGSVPPALRQRMVDEFTDRKQPCVLVSQIQAGGVGLNIQAGSVVILTEPQWKPSMEDQAVARCHRMGQARTVGVHRLLAEDTVDQRMLEILASKAVIFDEYVRKSALKDGSPDAVDISNIETTRGVVNQAEAERRIVELERRRLGIDSPQNEGATDDAKTS